MNRKHTILLAVFINAGLLIVLFVTAMTSQEEIAIPPTHEVAAVPKVDAQPIPLFEAPSEGMAPPTLPAAAPVEPVIAAAPEQPVHPLPPLVPEGLPPASPPPSTAIASAHAEVTVKRGDTLEKIARAHKTSVEEIIKLNHLPSSFLRIGQVLKLPTKGSSVPKMATAQSRPRAPEAGLDYYTVKVGDNPWTIAMKHHLKVDELLKLNGLNEEKARKLKPGDRLRIR